MTWTLVSIVMFIPFVHIHPFVMMSQAYKSKVRLWYALACGLLLLELALFGSFVYFFGAMSRGMLLTIAGSSLSYIVGNGLLLNQARPYLQRIELAEVRKLTWINSIASQRNRELATPVVDTPQLFIERLVYWQKQIQNKQIHRDIDKIIRLFHLLERKDLREAEKFLVRHSTIVQVLIQYNELEQANLRNDVSSNAKAKLAQVVHQGADAIEREVSNQFQIGLLDIAAETDVYLQSLKNRNLLKD